ncbi:Peroxidase 12 [Morella rubra]|uniref:Peroxidase n=1 Tax=Morella rubra TaxID=262757 RepID=A0A6A1WAS2_9ROSI|nr:Peroxidase 12 [Morella rubra]
MAGLTSFLSLVFISSLFLASNARASEVKPSVPIVKGLSWSFYDSSCPKLESIVRKHLNKVFNEDIGQAAGLLRLHFHDCFVQGCDGSILLDGSASDPSEQEAPPNLSLRARAFQIIDELQELVQKQCGRVVSCADLTALAARDSVFLSGGPEYSVPFGRRDALNFATIETTLANIPGPNDNTSVLLTRLATKNLDATDLVALSGGHTIGIGHCAGFTNRLYPTRDPIMDETFFNNLKEICPSLDSNGSTVLDIRSPNKFDNQYYVDLMFRQGLFISDQDLFMDSRTRDSVTGFALDEELFFEEFVNSMTKMGQLSVLTGKRGEIRANCSVRNSKNTKLSYVVEEEDEAAHYEL